MSTSIFKPTIWSTQIQNQLDTLTGLKSHSDFSYQGEIKRGRSLIITGAIRPTVGNYVPGTDIKYEQVAGTTQELPIDIYKYATQTFDDVDEAQSIPGVMENASSEMSKALNDEENAVVAEKMRAATESGVEFTANDGSTKSKVKVPQESSATDVTKANALTRIDDGIQALQENNVSASTLIYGEFSPKYYKFIKQALTPLLTDNVEVAKSGAVGMYNKVAISIENLLPITKDKTAKLNFLRTGKAVAFAAQVEKTEAGRLEKQFADYVRALVVMGCKVVRPLEMYAIKEKVSTSTTGA